MIVFCTIAYILLLVVLTKTKVVPNTNATWHPIRNPSFILSILEIRSTTTTNIEDLSAFSSRESLY